MLHCGNCLDVMCKVPSASIDMALSDVPYGKTQNEWDQPIPFEPMWKELHRVTKPDGAIVLMAAQPFAAQLICSNLANFRYDLIWFKNKPTGFLNAKRQPLRAHEHILVFYRKPPLFEPQMTTGHEPVHAAVQTSHGKNYGKKTQRIESGGSTERYPLSVLRVPIVNNDSPEKVHPTQKPVALMAWLVASYTRRGDTVLDFAMGAGTTGVACADLGRQFIGIELRNDFFALAQSRLAVSKAA